MDKFCSLLEGRVLEVGRSSTKLVMSVELH